MRSPRRADVRRAGPGSGGTFTLDAQGPPGLDTYLDAYQNHLEGPYRHPTYASSTARAFSGTFHNAVFDDIVIAEYQATTRIRTAAVEALEQEQVRLYVVHHGTLLLDDPLGQGALRLTTGTFFLGHVTQEYHFDTTASSISALNVLVPTTLLGGLVTGEPVVGRAVSAPLRMLAAHATMIRQNLPALGRAGRESAGRALGELLKGVALSRFDDQEPAFVPALVRAAQELAEQFLADPDLSPALIAARLHVSVRTLQRSFATTAEPLSAYIRRRRLEEATRMLATPRPPSISDVAAHWLFTDSSHFVRAFRKHHGRTPSDFVRLHRPDRT